MFFHKNERKHRLMRKWVGIIVILSFLLSCLPQEAIAKEVGESEGGIGEFIGELMDRSPLRVGDDGDEEEPPTPTEPDPTEQGPVDLGAFKNVKHTITLDEGYGDLCQRNMTGTIEFDWPEPRTMFDIVVIQDLSGSFEKTISYKSERFYTGNPYVGWKTYPPGVGKAMLDIIDNLNMGVDADGVSPRDRITFTVFRGQEGMYLPAKYANGYVFNMKTYDDDIDFDGTKLYYMNYPKKDDYGVPYHLVQGNGSLLVDAESAKEYVKDAYLPNKTYGGTPTIDGMVEGKKNYKNLIEESNQNYDQAEYQIQDQNGKLQARKRKTIYLLVTDGAANTAKWNNLPQATKDELNIPAAFTPGNFDDSDANRSYVWNENRNSSIDGVKGYVKNKLLWKAKVHNSNATLYSVSVNGDNTSEFNLEYGESFQPMLTGMKILASDYKSAGGLGETQGALTGNAEFVTAFWEDRDLLVNTYGTVGWGTDTSGMKKIINDAMKDMASKNTDDQQPYFVTSNDMQTFQSGLIAALREVASPIFDQVTIDMGDGVISNLEDGTYTIERKTEEGNWVPAQFGPKTRTESTSKSFKFDMSSLKEGTYRITYKVSEDRFMDKDYEPVTLSMTYEGETQTFVKGKDLPNYKPPKIPLNERTDCEINISKYVASQSEPDYNSKRELAKQGEPFTFKSSVKLTSAVQDIGPTGYINIYDMVDPRVNVTDAYATFTGGTEGSVAGDPVSVAYTPVYDEDDETKKIGTKIDHKWVVSNPDDPQHPYAHLQGGTIDLYIKGTIDPDISHKELEEILAPDPSGGGRRYSEPI